MKINQNVNISASNDDDNTQYEDYDDDDEARIYCAQIGCHKYYTTMQSIKLHIKRIHPEVTVQNLDSSDIKEADNKLPTYHVFSKGKFTCVFCQKTFSSIHNLKDHIFVHTDVRPFACNVCDKKFKKIAFLKKHQEIHERPFHCPYCDRTFFQESLFVQLELSFHFLQLEHL